MAHTPLFRFLRRAMRTAQTALGRSHLAPAHRLYHRCLGRPGLQRPVGRHPAPGRVSPGVLTFYLGGDEAQLDGTKATEKGPQFVNSLKQHIPALGQPVERFSRTYWGQDRDIGGGYTSFKPGQYTEFSSYLYIESDAADERQDVAVGNLVFAGEQFSDEYYGFMNGGAQTGRLAAEVVASRVQAIALPEVSRPLRRA